MNAYQNEEYFDIAGTTYEVLQQNPRPRGIYATAARVYAARYPGRHQPNYKVFQRVHSNALVYGSFQSPRPRNNEERENPNTNAVLAQIAANPHTSTRAIAEEIGTTSHATVWRVLNKNNFKPFKVHVHQDLNEEDFERREEFATWAVGQVPRFFRRVLYSDESTFYSDGIVNRHNSHYWSVENPHWMVEKQTQGRWSVNVWCGLIDVHVVGPHFFDVPLTGPVYADFIRNDLPGYMDDLPLNLRRNLWFQQDAAPPHYHREARAAVTEMFGNRWIGRLGREEQILWDAGNDGPVPWPARCPDFSSLDFFLWGHVKGEVNTTRPENREELKERIRLSIHNIPREVLRRVADKCMARYQACLNVNGGHFEHLIGR